MSNTADLIATEQRLGAHNYKPLDVVLTRGQGVHVWDSEGKQYLDCLSAYSAVNQGHCHPRILAAMTEQASKLTLTSRAFRNDQLALLYEELAALTGSHKILPMNSGAEAVETAIKAVRKWGYETKGVPEGKAEFATILPRDRPLVDPSHVYQVGIRSVDEQERLAIAENGVNVFDMRAIDEDGMGAIMRRIIADVSKANGLLHVSLDVDFLDPDVAPGVGTTVPGGATFREAHLIMEMLHDSGLVSSLDLVELNPFLDDRGKSARVIVELAASLFGRRILDRPTRAA